MKWALIAVTAVVAATMTSSVCAKVQHGPRGHYTARLGPSDHFNSNGVRLTTVAAIIRQDRATFHRFGIRDPEDEWDSFFSDADNRARLESLIAGGTTSSATRSAIVNGQPLIHVDIYDGYVNVVVY